MKLKTLLFLSPILLGTSLPLFIGCDRLSPLMPPPPPTPTPQVLWANGIVGTWFTNALTENPGGTTTNAVTAVADPISGDTSALFLATTSANGFYYLSASSAINPSLYYSGHLQFDILSAQPSSSITSMSIAYVNYLGSGNCGDYDFPATLIGTLSTISFTHVSIPLVSFTNTTGGCNGYFQTSVDTPFQISWAGPSGGTTITLDNIKWTFN